MRRVNRILFAITIIGFSFSGAASGQFGDPERVEFGRYPALSPDGSAIAFSWAGDLWTVPVTGGNATRLTSSDGYDYYPVWSPDGRKIAFSSDRYGSEDLYVIDKDGGTPYRVTYASNGDILSGWTSDGNGLIFSSRRGGMWPDHRAPQVVYLSDSRGYGPSTPQKLVPSSGLGAVMHPDSNIVAFQYGPETGWRQGYTGTHAEDIWLYYRNSGEFERVTNNSVENSDVQWSADGTTLYYRSEESEVGNVWAWDLNTKHRSQITDVIENGLWSPKVGGPTGNEMIIFERSGEIYTQSVTGGDPHPVNIYAWSDETADEEIKYSTSGSATEYAVSPDGMEMAFVVRGEIYCVRTDGIGGTEAARLTNHPAHDDQISWYPRGDSLIFTSDRDGVEQLYRVKSGDPSHERLSEARRFEIEKLTDNDQICTSAVIGPDLAEEGSVSDPSELTIAYLGNVGDLWLMDGNGGHQRKLFSHWGTYQYTFSPDGRWLAFTKDNNDYNTEIYIAAVDPDDETLPDCPKDGFEYWPDEFRHELIFPDWHEGAVNVTRHPDDDYNPVWSPDGTKLGFTSERNWDNTDPYFVFLTTEDEERSLAEWELEDEPLQILPPLPGEEEEEEEVDESGEVSEVEGDEEIVEEEAEEEFVVDIDFRNIHLRARRLTSLDGSEVIQAFSPDGKSLVYSSNSDGSMDLWQMDWTGENVTELTNGADPGQVTWNMQNERIYFLGGGRVSSRKNGGGDAMNHAFNAEFSVKALDEKLYKYNEVWRIQNKWFYDADFHGRDWNALGDEYRGLYAESRHYRDANDAMNQLLGRLNSSHLWYSEAGSPPPGPDTGYLGCEFIEDENPGLIVDRITPDTPIAREEFGIEWEDRIVSINGYDVGGWGENPVGNWWRALESTVGKSIELGYIKWDDETDTVNWIRVTPTDYWGWYQAEYENWIEGNRAYIEMLTYEQVGYLHIQRMYDDSLERFEQDLYAAANGKKALVIDVRYNSGGWTTDWLLAMLNTERHALTVPRDGGYGYPEDRTPVYTTDIPVIVLCNEWSFSNAEIFSHAIKNLGRGVLVGWPTGGGVISTGNMSLADGSRLSLPRRGWYAVNPDTMEILYNMEGQAAIPDYMYEITPWDLAAGIDPQLDLAVDAEIDMMSGGG